MNVGELKRLLEGKPDDMVVVVSGHDHSFGSISRHGSQVRRAEHLGKKHRNRSREFLEYAGEEHKSFPDSPVVEVLWLDDGRY